MRRMRRLFVLAAAALVVPVAAQAANPVVKAAERTAKLRTSKMTMVTRTTVPGVGVVVASGSGVQRGQSVKLTIRSSAGGASVSMDLIGLVEAGHFVMYMRSPVFRGQLPSGKTWVRFDLQEQGQKLGVDVSALLGPTQAAAPLWHGLVATRRLGTDVVAGTRASHYRVRVDYDRAAAALPAFGKQLAAVERATGVDLRRADAEVWVGANGLVRRLRTTTPTVVQGVRATSVQTITYTGYNVPVSIAAPPRSRVFELPG